MARQLVILDRDGVINKDSADFIKSPEEWVPIPGSMEAIGVLTRAGFTVAIASNQSGIARRLLDLPALKAIHEKMRVAARAVGGDIDKIVFCPHHPDDECLCRKPAPGLLHDVARYYGVSLNGVPVIGDSLRDLEAAIAVDARPILVLSGNGTTTSAELAARAQKMETFANLAEAADALVAEAKA